MQTGIFTYRLSDAAKEDMAEIYDYISFNLSNPDAADAFFDEFDIKAVEICKSSKSGIPVNNEYIIRDDVRKFLVKNYIAYYIADFENNEIQIARVVYGGMDQEKVFRKTSF